MNIQVKLNMQTMFKKSYQLLTLQLVKIDSTQ